MDIVRRKLILVTIGTYRVKITLLSRITHKKDWSSGTRQKVQEGRVHQNLTSMSMSFVPFVSSWLTVGFSGETWFISGYQKRTRIEITGFTSVPCNFYSPTRLTSEAKDFVNAKSWKELFSQVRQSSHWCPITGALTNAQNTFVCCP